MRLNILIAGKAGIGLNEASHTLARAFVNLGYYVFNYREYGSLIIGGHNFNILCVSEKSIFSYDNSFDIAILFDEASLKLHEKEFKKSCLILTGFESKKGVYVNSGEFSKVANMYLAGSLFKILNLDKKVLDDETKRVFAGKSLLEFDLKAIDMAYSRNYKEKLKLEKPDKEKRFYMTGAEATGIAAIEAGLDVYLGYPMTPATSLLTFLSQNQKNNYFVFEPENEIAVANSALGASYSGARVMIGSSGGGFDLMTEAMSFQGMTEIPLVVYLASRPGPSSGTPTYSSQQDLNLAINCGHGEFPRVVIAPGDIEESYKAVKEAFYLAEKFKVLSLILTDKHLAESGYTQKIENYDLFIEKKNRVGKEIVRINSYSHDEKGDYSENPEVISKLMEHFKKKEQDIKKEIEKFETFKIYGNKESKKVIVSFGSTKGAILDSLDKLKNYKFIHIIYAHPFTEKLIKEIEKAKEIFVVEGNYSGQLADLIQKNTGKMIDDKHRILKYDARAFTPEDVVGRLK